MIARSFRFAAAMAVTTALCITALLPAPARAEFKVREISGFAESFFNEDFSQPGNWPSTTDNLKATVADGQLTVVTQKARGSVRLPVKIGAAAGWRAQADVRIAEAAPDDKDAFVGLAFAGALNDKLYVSMDRAGNLSVEYLDHKGNYAKPDPVANVRADSAHLEPGATNTLAVERQDGYFRIFVNGDYVTRTRIIDFTPRQLGVMTYCGKPSTATFDNLSLVRMRYDGRFQRLLGQGTLTRWAQLVADDFTRRPGQQERWWTGDAGRVRVEIKDGAYFMRATGKDDLSSSSNVGADISQRRYPGIPRSTRFAATVACVAGDCGYARGIFLAGPADAQGNRAQLMLQVTNSQLRVFYDPLTGDRVNLQDWTPSASLDGPSARLHLVATADRRLLVFVNNDFQAAFALPEGFTVEDMGLSHTGPQDVSFDDVAAHDF